MGEAGGRGGGGGRGPEVSTGRRDAQERERKRNETANLSFSSLTDSGYRSQHLADVQLVEDRGLACSVEAEHDDLKKVEGQEERG